MSSAARKLIPVPMEVQITANISPRDVIHTAIVNPIKHVVQSDGQHFDSELASAKIFTQSPELFFKKPVSCILYGNESLTESQKRLFSLQFRCVSDKDVVLGQLEATLLSLVKSTSHQQEIIAVADEMITNAIFNAPFVDVTNSKAGASRFNKDLSLEAGQHATFFVGATDDRILIGCTDPFGKLNVPNLLKRIRNCYDNSVAGSMNMHGPGGAGIGTYMIFNMSMSSFIGVVPGTATQFCSVFSRAGSNREREQTPKNLHLIF